MQSNHITKRLTAGLLSLVMLLTLLPTAVFAEEVTEDAPLCVCETACTAESLNADCPVCGAEGAAETDCGLYTAPDPEPDPEPTVEPETPVVPTVPAASAEPEEYVPAEPQDAKTVQAMIDALPDADDAADMTEEELEAAYSQAADAYTAFELLDAEEMQSITGVEKILALLDALTGRAAVLAEATSTQADDIFTYKNNSDGTGFIVTGLTDKGKAAAAVTIPDTFTGDVTVTYENDEGKEVTETTKNVTLPVVEVGGAAFRNCDNLQKLTLGKNIRVIRANAIAVYSVNNGDFVSNLEEVVIPADSVLEEIGHNAFQNNRQLKRIGIVGEDGTATATLPASLTYIGGYAFYGCTALTEVNFAEGAVLKTIGDAAFAGSGLVNVTMPDSVELLGHSAFAACPNLKTVTVSEKLDFTGLRAFSGNESLESVTFRGRYPLKNFGLGGFENYLTFEGVNENCTVYVPQPANDTEYANVLDSVYSPNRGAASPLVKLLWWDNTDALPKDKPNTPAVTAQSLNDLNSDKSKTELEKAGITIKTTNQDGCAAVITVKEGSGTKATLKAELAGVGNVYWITVEAFAGRTAGIEYTGGSNLTNAISKYVYRRSSGGDTITLDTTGKQGRTVFYFPIATNYGSKDAPERSAVGTPVKVEYVADQAEPGIVGTGNKRVYFGNGQYGQASVSRPISDTVYIDGADGNRQAIEAYAASAPDQVYLTTDANGITENHAMRACVTVPGFEVLIPNTYRDENGELIENYTPATNYKSDSNDEASIRYQWYIAYDGKDTTLTDSPLDAHSSANGTAVYAGHGGNGALLWRIGRPSNTALEQVLKPGMNFLYAVITVTQNGDTTRLTTPVTEFYCFDDDFQVTLTSDNWVTANIEEKKDKDGKLTKITETSVASGAERVLTVALDKTKVESPQSTTMTKQQKIDRYQAMFDACYKRIYGSIYYLNELDKTFTSEGLATSGRSFAVPTEWLGKTKTFKSNSTGEQDSCAVAGISVGSGDGVSVDLQFGDDSKNGIFFHVPVYCCKHGNTSLNTTILSSETKWWTETEGTPESPAWDYDSFWIYLTETVNDEDWDTKAWSSGAYVAELYEVDAPDQTRGGTKVLDSSADDFDDDGYIDTIQDINVYDPDGKSISTHKAVEVYLWDGDVHNAAPGVHYYYWRVYKADTPRAVDYSPVFARFQDVGMSGASMTITAGQTEATFLANTLELPFVLRGVNIAPSQLVSDYTKQDGTLQLQYQSGNTWTAITGYPGNYGWKKDADVGKNASTIMSGSSLFSTMPYTVTLIKKLNATVNGSTNFFDAYDTDEDGQVTLRLAWIKSGSTPVYSESVTVTNANSNTPVVTLNTSASLDGAKLGNNITRKVEYLLGENDVPQKDENNEYITLGNSVILTAKAHCWEGNYATVTWEVKYGNQVFTLGEDDLNSDKPLTIGDTIIKVTGYEETVIRGQRGDDDYATTMTLEIPAPTTSRTDSFTLTPKAEVSRTTDYSTITGTATAPFYTLTHNPAAYAERPYISTQLESRNYKPGTTTAEPLTAEATVSDGGALTWQWYRANSATSTTGETAIAGAAGSGGKATYTLPDEVLRDVGMHYYYCRFTNTNPSVTSNTKTSTADTNIVRINVSEDMVEVGKPIISAGIDEYTFQWANLDQLTDNATTLVVQKPAALKGAEPSWVTFPTPRQSEVLLELFVEKWDTAKEKWVQVNYSDDRARFDAWNYLRNPSGTSGALTCMEIGDYYYYYTESLDSWLRSSYTGRGIGINDPVRFRLEWKVTHVLDAISNSNFQYPTNLAGETTTTATETVYIVRTPVTMPTLEDFIYVDNGGDEITVNVKFEEGVGVQKGGVADVTLDGKAYTNIPTIQLAAESNSSLDRNAIIRAQLPDGVSRLAKIEARIERWDAEKKAWTGTNCRNDDCSRDRESGISLYYNPFGTPEAGDIDYCRIRLYTVENNIKSAAVYSDVFAIQWVERKDAEAPTAPAGLDTDSKKWYYQPEGWNGPETASLALGEAVGLWKVNDGGELSYQWSYRYDDADGDWVDGGNIAGATDSTLKLVTGEGPMATILPIMKAKSQNADDRSAVFTLTVTNTNNLVTGERTKTTTKTFRIDFDIALSTPAASIVTPEAGTTVSTGTSIPLSLNIANQEQLDAQSGTLAYRWYYQYTSVPDAKGLLHERDYDTGLDDYDAASTSLETMGESALHYDFADAEGTSSWESFTASWWAAHPNAEIKLNVYCEITHSKSGYTTQTTTTNPLEFTLTRPTFNQGLEVKTYDAAGQLVKTYDLDPTENVVVPTNGKVVFTLTRADEAHLGNTQWCKQPDGAVSSSIVGTNISSYEITYDDLCSDGTFQPCEVWASVCSNINTGWYMDTVKVKLTSNNVATPTITGIPESKFVDPGGSVALEPEITGDVSAPNLTYRWYVKENGEWKTGEGTAFTGSSLNVTMPDEINATRAFKLVVTNTVGDESVSAEKTCTVTTRGVTLSLPETMPEAVSGSAYDLPLNFTWVGETLADSEVTWSELPESYRVEKRTDGYHLVSSDPKVLNTTLTVTVSPGGLGKDYTASVTLSITPAAAPTGVSVKGQVKSYNPKNATTIQLMQGDAVKYTATIAAQTTGSGQVTQTFELTGVAAGTYDLVVTKACHLTYTITGVTVGTEALDLTTMTGKAYQTITLLAGDVDGGGSINESDVSIIRYATNINKPTLSAANPLADVNGDGNINESDASIVRYAVHINKNTTHCTYHF